MKINDIMSLIRAASRRPSPPPVTRFARQFLLSAYSLKPSST